MQEYLNDDKNNRGEKPSPQTKLSNFKKYKDNTFHSLNDVEHFLGNFKHYSKYLKIYKLFGRK